MKNVRLWCLLNWRNAGDCSLNCCQVNLIYKNAQPRKYSGYISMSILLVYSKDEKKARLCTYECVWLKMLIKKRFHITLVLCVCVLHNINGRRLSFSFPYLVFIMFEEIIIKLFGIIKIIFHFSLSHFRLLFFHCWGSCCVGWTHAMTLSIIPCVLLLVLVRNIILSDSIYATHTKWVVQ